MRKLKQIGLLAVTLLFGLTLTACARSESHNAWPRIKQERRVVIGLDDSFVPMGFRAKSGELRGYDIDLARAVFKRYGVKCDFQTIDWAMKETELRNQTIDLIWNGYSVTPDRAKKVGFSKPYLDNHQVLVSLKKNNIQSFADMKGKILGAQSGSSGADDIDAEPAKLKNIVADRKPVLYATFNDAFIDLTAGRIQGLVIDEVYARYYIAHQKNPDAYRLVQGEFPSESFAVGLRQHDTVLAAKINDALKALKADGTLARLQKKWFGNTHD